LSFTKAGTYKITATDISNTAVKGEQTVVAGGTGTGTQTQQISGSGKPIITTPVSGSYSQNVQTISGSTDPGATIKIYDNEQEIGSVQASSDGKYTYQTNPLADGKHSLYVVALDSAKNIKGTSDPTEINIDTTPPVIDEIQLDPSTGIKAGTIINVKVFSEENLSDAALVFNNEIIALTPSADQPGEYIGSINAPQTLGDYPLDVVLVDNLNNEGNYKNKATVSVTEEGGTIQTQETQETQAGTQETQESANMPPSQVLGLIAYGSNKRVTLVWEAASDDKQVNHYRIYYGLDQVNLDNVKDTRNAATTWYIPDLANGKEYYFAVVAVDNENTESATRSDTVSAIPFTLETNTITERPSGALTGGSNMHGASLEGNIPPEMSKNGPEVIWLLYGTGLMSGLVQAVRRKKRK
jgi:hypothetical protein